MWSLQKIKGVMLCLKSFYGNFCVKAPGFADRKGGCIDLIQPPLRYANRRSFHTKNYSKNFSDRALAAKGLLLCILPFCLLSAVVEGEELHAIIVCDTTADNIGPSVHADLKKVHQEMVKIAYHTELKLHVTKFSNHEVNTAIIDFLKRQNFSSDDVVMFFFSGHGYRTNTKQENIWPNLYMTPAQKGIDFNLIVNTLKEKKPRLLIAIADCCNNIIPEELAPPTIKKFDLYFGLKQKNPARNYKELFLNHNGAIIISSSKPGEYSWGTRYGGLFTVAFFESLSGEVNAYQLPDWHVLLDKAAMKVVKRDLGQTPQFELSLKAAIRKDN